jgi:hypothetical protein
MTTGGQSHERSTGASSPSAEKGLDDEQELREDIEQTRARLGETVERLAAKADVKGQARAKAAELTGRMKNRVKNTAVTSRAKATERAASVRGQLAGKTAAVRQQAAAAGGKGKGELQARLTPAWEAAPEPVRRTVAKGASTARQRRAPLAAALVGLVVCYVIVQRWRKR